ncbi:MAG: isoprenylcysteine carboxylmethyltransferase family protein [Gammaproteobacteria bacterium]|nr:isoprenylcysteine carboxylmethyltransferase family protein [Gammaproteobacteria bacterium]
MKLPLVCFILCAVLIFGFRVGLQLRRTGDHGLRLAKQTSTATEVAATVLQACALFGVLVLTVLDTMSHLPGQLDLGLPGTIAGVVVCALAVAITMLSQYQMGDAWRIGVDASEKNRLVTDGMFKLSRNPIYSGMLLVGIGFVMLVPHVLMVCCAVLSYIGFEIQVRKVEEPYLRSSHGENYGEYCRNVGRYFPRLRGTRNHNSRVSK